MITYPLNNILYSAEDAELFHCTRTSGVFSAGDEFAASVTGADNTVTIGPGIAWIRNARFSGKVAANKTSVSLDMGLADGSYPRIDAVVIRFDANANQTAIVVKQGVAASSPTPPEVVQTEAIYELHLYHVRRAAGAAVVSAAGISDMRQDRNYCGVMMDDVTNIDENKFLAKTAYDPTGTVESAGGIPAYIAENAPKTTVVDSVTSTSTTSAASAASVKKAYDQAVAAKNAIPSLSSSVSSTSATTAATSNAVKQAYDRANTAFNSASNNETSINNLKKVTQGTIGPIQNDDKCATLTVNWAKCGRIVNMKFTLKTNENGGPRFYYSLGDLAPLIDGIEAMCRAPGSIHTSTNGFIYSSNEHSVYVHSGGFNFNVIGSGSTTTEVTVYGSICYISAS